MAEVRPGGYLLYDSSWPLDPELYRDDVTFVGVPLAEMCNEHFREPRERVLMKNIATAGALIELLNIDQAIVEKLVEEKYGRKKGLRESNQKAAKGGWRDYVSSTIRARCRSIWRRCTRTTTKPDQIETRRPRWAAFMRALLVAAWYPITPSTSTMDAFAAFCARYRKDKQRRGGEQLRPDPPGGRRRIGGPSGW